jgi:hypothetical protein
MLCFTLANVLLSDRIARSDFRFVPWVALLAACYAGVLFGIRPRLLSGTPEAAFRTVSQLLCFANFLLLALAGFFSRLGSADATVQARSEAAPAAAR